MIVAPVALQLVTNTPLLFHFQYQLGAKNKAVVWGERGQKAPTSEEAEISHPSGAWGLYILQTCHQGSRISFFSKIIQAHAVLLITDDSMASCSHRSLDGPMLGHQDAGIGAAWQVLTVSTQV